MSEGFLTIIKRKFGKSSETLNNTTQVESVQSFDSADSKTSKSVNNKRASPKTVSRQIDRQLIREQQHNTQRFQILLLGGSECGKTTIFKQIKILHLNGFTDEEKEIYRRPILRNVLDSMSQLLTACEDLHIVHEHSLQSCVNDFHTFYGKVSSTDAEKEITIVSDMSIKIQRLWKSSSIQMAYQRRWRFYLLDSAKYFLDAIVRVTEKHYMPEVQDILQCRFPTKGTEEIRFNYQNMNFTMIDVGGQRSERRKWIHVFDQINMMLFVAALSDYDLTDPENGSQNRLVANRYIFRTLVQSSFFRNAAIVLFFNKIDTFQEKLNNSPMIKHVTEYTGQNTVEECSKFLGNQFRQCVKEKHKFFMFCTTATDTRNVEFMFGSALTHIINENLRATGSY